MESEDDLHASSCPLFGVESGAPIIGLGILIILFGLIPVVFLQIPVPIPILLIFITFGVFLIWAGLTR